MVDPWHALSYAEREEIAHGLGLAADRHFYTMCGQYGFSFHEILEYPTLAVEIARLERIADREERRALARAWLRMPLPHYPAVSAPPAPSRAPRTA